MDTLFGIHTLFRFDVLGTSVGLPVGVVVQWGVMALAFLAVFLMRRNAKPAPMALQNFSEILASTLKRWTSRKKAAGRAADQASGSAGKRLDPSPEGLSAAVVTAAIFLFVFWLTEAVTTLTTSPGPVSRLVGWLAPGFNALKEQTIVGPILARFSGQDIGTEITSAIQVREIFGFDLFGIHIAVADVVVVMWVVMLFLLLVSLWLGRGFHPVPKGKQLVAENLVVSFQKLCGTVMDPTMVEKYAPFVGSLCLFIGLCNVTSTFRLPPPAKNPAFPIALAITSIGIVIAGSIRAVGWKGFARSMTFPKWWMLPFKVLDFVIKLVSLSLRLFGNIFGAFILMEFAYVVAPILLPGLLGLWFDIADGIIQGLVFAYLTALYVGEVVENAHHEPA